MFKWLTALKIYTIPKFSAGLEPATEYAETKEILLQ
jgi:hypothetical protein